MILVLAKTTLFKDLSMYYYFLQFSAATLTARLFTTANSAFKRNMFWIKQMNFNIEHHNQIWNKQNKLNKPITIKLQKLDRRRFAQCTWRMWICFFMYLIPACMGARNVGSMSPRFGECSRANRTDNIGVGCRVIELT